MSSLISGGYCDGVPPLPIPNREVKPVCADGTAMQCGRVGSRLLLQKTLDNRNVFQGLFLFLCFLPSNSGYSCNSDYSNSSVDSSLQVLTGKFAGYFCVKGFVV